MGWPDERAEGVCECNGRSRRQHADRFLTEYAANYIINESEPSLTSLRTEGEWCGNWCMHIRDDATGAVLDVRGKSLSYRADGGIINDVPTVDPGTNPSFVAVEAAHFYPCANAGWLLTEDPFFLEELQFGCNWQLLFNQYHRNAQGLQGLVYPGQTRSFAWGLRDLFVLTASCPINVPQWLRPKDYWRACVDDNRTFAEKFVNSPARIHALCKTWTRSDADPAWQTAWLNAVTGIAIVQGFNEWRSIFTWGVDKHIQQTNGTSGWPREWPVPYYSIPNKAAIWGTPTVLFATTAIDATTCTSWSDYWTYYKSGSPDASGVLHSDANGHVINDTGWDGHTIMQSQSTPSYFLHLRAALAMAAAHGIPNARACYDYVQGELASNVMARYNAMGQASLFDRADTGSSVACCSGKDGPLRRPLVERSGWFGVWMGRQLRTSGRLDLRDLVHLRKQWATLVAVLRGHSGKPQQLFRKPDRDKGSVIRQCPFRSKPRVRHHRRNCDLHVHR
jgi:hypothetical protein